MKRQNEEYAIYTDNKDIYDRAIELGYDNITLYKSLDELKKEERYIVILYYCNEDEEGFDDDKQAKEHDEVRNKYNKRIRFINIWDFEYSSFQEALDKMVNQLQIESNLIYNGKISETNFRGRCGNCHAKLLPRAKYCHICGTKRGEGKFEPFYNEVMLVYGPPITQVVTCKDCGHKFKIGALGYPEANCCPKCGKKNLSVKELNVHEW